MQAQVINKPLQDLLQTAQFVTPSGNDTVAAKVAQAAQQKMQTQAAPPGIEALMPGVKQQAMMAAQAAQPATQGDVNQLRQMMAQAAQSQGIAAGADVPMAEGGIVGYASRGYVDPQFPEVYETYNEPSAGELRTGREEEELFGPVKTPRQRAIEAVTEELLGPMSKERLAAAARMPQRAPAPRPAASGPVRTAQRRPTGATQTAAPAAPMLPDTREPTTVNPSESALMYAQLQGGLKELLERQSKPRERTPEELKEAAAREEEIKRRMGEIDASKARFEQAKQERLAGQQGQGLRDLASFLSRAGGARSGLAGLSEATLGMEPVLAARAAQEQKFREQELAFVDKLGERRDLVTDMRLASLRDDAGRAREDAARLRTLDMEISKLGLGLGEKRAGELARAELSREEAAGRLGQAREEMASREKVARMGLDARSAGAGAGSQRLALSQMKADPDYKRIQEELVAAGKLAMALPNNPRYKARLENAQKEYAKLAQAYGVDLKAAAPEAAAPTGKIYNFADIGGPK